MLQNRNKRRSDDDSPSPKVKSKREESMTVAGRLVQVELENFMCHGNLKVNFDVENHNCVYIGGPNGSGKSALFAAINLGLGGVGRSNDRGNSVQSYIKTGKTRAKTKITLTNTGEGSFPKYGERIIVERTIQEAGGSYQVKSVRGGTESVIPGGKAVLTKILSRFGIDLLNPIYWLSQDRARKFLADTNPKQLYQIFADASDLDTTLANYNEVGTHMTAINTNLTNVSTLLAALRSDYKKKQFFITRLEKEAILIAEIHVLHWLSQYSPLRDIEDQQKEVNRKIAENQAAHRKLKQKHKDDAVELADWRAKLETLAAETAERRGEVDDMERQLADYEEKMIPFMDKKNEVARQIKKVTQDIEQSDATIKDAQKKIQVEKEKLARNHDRQQMEHLQAKLEEIKELEAANSEEIQQISQNLDQATPKLREANAAAYEAHNQAQQLRVDYLQLSREIGSLQQRSKNNLNRFGNDMPTIVQMVNQEASQFAVKPKGPIGSYVHVRDKKFQLAVEQATRRHLGTFIFASRQDEDIFIRMISHNKLQCPPVSVVKMGQAPHETRDQEPPAEFATVLRMIDVADQDIRNALIDLVGIESIVLFESDERAKEIMNGSAPPYCRTAFTCSGAEVHGNNGYGNHQYRFYACHQRHATMLEESSTGNTDELNRQLQILKRQYDMANEEARKKGTRSEELKRLYDVQKKKKYDMEEQLRRFEGQRTRIRREIANIADREDGNVVIGAQQRLMQEVEESKAALQKEKNQLEQELRKKDKQLAKMRENCKQFKQQAEDHADKVLGTDSSAEGLRLKIQQLTARTQESETQMRMIDDKVKKWTNEDLVELDKKKDQADRKLKEEDQKPPPPNYKNPPDYRDIPPTTDLLNMIRRKEAELSGVQETLGDVPSEEQLRQIKNKFDEGRLHFLSLRQINQSLRETLELRKKKFPVFRHGIISRVKDAFQNLISYKFEGEMLINTDTRTINISIKPHSNNPLEKLKDIRGLSGGEKSYTTTCFLMALWTIMETPFRCMDEFDVFMDGHMRKTAMDLIVKEATHKYKHQQFIFFTPQGINEIKKDNTDHQVATFEMPIVRE